MREEKEEEKEEKKNMATYGNEPLPRPPWIWRRMIPSRMRTWFWYWGRIWSWPWRRMWSWPWRKTWPRKKDPGEAEIVANDHSIRVWSFGSTWWTQLWRRRRSEAGPIQPERLLPEAAKLYPGVEAVGVVRGEETVGVVRGGLVTGTNYSPGGSHMFHKSQYGSDELLGMETKVSSVGGWKYKKYKGTQKTIQALADSGASSSIISWDLAEKLDMTMYDKGEATLKDGSHNYMDVSGIGSIMVQEKEGIPLKITVLISKSLGEEELVIGLRDLKDMHILHEDFPRTLPEFRLQYSKPSQYNTMR